MISDADSDRESDIPKYCTNAIYRCKNVFGILDIQKNIKYFQNNI
jgi:hypothetical protein